MKTKTLLILGLVCVGIAILFFALNSHIYNEKQADVVPGETATIKGVVVAVDSNQITFDGPYVLTVRAEGGSVVNVAIPSMELPLCAAYKNNNIGDISLMKVGDPIEVRGAVSEDGSIVPCASADDYVRPIASVETDFEGEADPSRMTLDMKTWVWTAARYNDGREVKPTKVGKFTLTFSDGGKFTAKTDCNSMGGSYAAGADKTITFSNIFATKMYCEGSQESIFAQLLENTASYHFTSRGQLILDLKFDSGTLVFN